MAKHRNIEDKMKAVSDGEQTVPPAIVWDNINLELDRDEDKKRRGFFFLLFGLSLALVGVIGYTLMGEGFSDSQTSAIVEQSEDDLTVNIEQQTDEQPTKQITNKEVAEVSGIENQGTEIEVAKKEIYKTSSESKFANQLASKVKLDQEDVRGGEEVVNATEKINASQVIVDKVKFKNSGATSAYTSVDATRSTTSEKQSSLVVEAIKQEQKLIDDIAVLDTDIGSLAESQRVLAGLKTVECPTFTKSKSIPLPFLEFCGLFGTHTKSIEQGTGSQSLREGRNSTESSWLDYGAQFNVGWYLNSDFYVAGGIEATRATDKFDKSREGLTKLIIDYDIETGEATDTSFVTGNIVNSGIVRYQMIDLPIMLGYRRLVDKWSFGLEAAALINLKFSAEGKVVAEDQSVSTISDEGPIYKDNVGLGLKGSFVVGRYLAHGVSLQSRFTYKTYLDDVNDVSYELPTSMSFWRLELGIRKEF